MVDILNFNSGSSSSKQQKRGSTVAVMKAAKIWLMYKTIPSEVPGGKPRKVPYYGNGQARGETDTPRDRSLLMTYEQIIAIIAKVGPAYRPAIALGPDGHGGYWQGFDSDGTMEGASDWGGYVERSPSGTGYHVIGYGRGFRSRVSAGREFYSSARFFTFTGDMISDGEIIDLYDAAGTGPLVPREERGPVERESLTEREKLDLWNALQHISADPYDNWYRVALALRSVDCGLDIFMKWSATSEKHDDATARRKFEGMGDPIAHWKSIFNWAIGNGWDPNWQDKAAQAERERVMTTSRLNGLMLPSLTFNLKAHVFTIDGIVDAGFVLFAGEPGAGKTTLLVALGLAVADRADLPILPSIRFKRHVFYFSEAPVQIEEIIIGMKQAGLLQCDAEELNEMFHVCQAERMTPKQLEATLNEIADNYTLVQDFPAGTFDVPPLVIFDTLQACVLIENENDAGEMQDVAAKLQNPRINVWTITHTPKGQRNEDVEKLQPRGSTALIGAASQIILLGSDFKKTKDNDPAPAEQSGGDIACATEEEPANTRMLYLQKSRFSVRTPYVRTFMETMTIQFTNQYGEDDEIALNYISSVEPKTALQAMTEKENDSVNAVEEKERRKERMSDAGFKKFIEEQVKLAPGQGVALLVPPAIDETRPLRPRVPEGYVPLSYRNIRVGSSRDRKERLASWLSKQELRRSEDGCFFLFDKPDFGV